VCVCSYSIVIARGREEVITEVSAVIVKFTLSQYVKRWLSVIDCSCQKPRTTQGDDQPLFFSEFIVPHSAQLFIVAVAMEPTAKLKKNALPCGVFIFMTFIPDVLSYHATGK